MSCHDIGRGMNSVVRVAIGLYDNGSIGKDAAMQIVRACAKGVNWCDGNTDEAIDYFSRCRCGKCFAMVPEGEKLYSVWHVSAEVPQYYDIDKNFNLLSSRLCETCFDAVLNEHCKDDRAGLRERKYIEEHDKPEDYTSTGHYAASNNGCRWVD